MTGCKLGRSSKKRNRKGDDKCMVCGVVETRDHILFCCLIAKFIWACFRDALGWGRSPDRLQEVWEELVPLCCSNHKLKLFLVGVVFLIEGVCPRTPSDVMYKILSFVQRWHVLLGGEDQSICSTLARPTRG
jgi:hypothetical protein